MRRLGIELFCLGLTYASANPAKDYLVPFDLTDVQKPVNIYPVHLTPIDDEAYLIMLDKDFQDFVRQLGGV